jgi:hypothetical protein
VCLFSHQSHLDLFATCEVCGAPGDNTDEELLVALISSELEVE